ncbi:MAG: carboxylesterase family protein [Thermodesulfobacteriota bacterium]
MKKVTNTAGNEVLVCKTAQGRISGMRWDEHTLAWLGVPYARPPVGELRWKAPRDPEPWDGVRDASSFSPACMQYGGLLLTLDPEKFGQPCGSEDCLYLNVWRPDSAKAGLPVFFYLHGGLNAAGEGATSLYHGANLARQAKAVVVTINHRLGIFGWFAHPALATGDPLDDSGNYGILDIIKALSWVRDNIVSFGGDPKNVTACGESAGSFNVLSLVISPLARGLFHRALCLSPLTPLFGAKMKNVNRLAKKQAARMAVADGLAQNPEDARKALAAWEPARVKDFLYAKDAKAVLAGTRPLSSLGLNELGITLDVLSGSRFLDGTVIPKDMKQRLLRGDYNKVPYMVGNTQDEIRIFLLSFGIFSKPDTREVARLIREFDPQGPAPNLARIVPRRFRELYKLAGTGLGKLAFEKNAVGTTAKTLSRHQDVYVFRFAWDEQPKPFDFLVGSSHMTGLPFVFGNFQTDDQSIFRFSWSNANRTGTRKLHEDTVSYLASFFQTGNPNTGKRPDLPEWTPWTLEKGRKRRMVLDTETRMSR